MKSLLNVFISIGTFILVIVLIGLIMSQGQIFFGYGGKSAKEWSYEAGDYKNLYEECQEKCDREDIEDTIGENVIENTVNNESVIANFEDEYKKASLPYSDMVVCQLKVTTVAAVEDGDHFEAKGSLESKPLSIVLMDIDTEYPKIIAEDGSTTEIVKFDTASNDDVVYMFETTGFGNLVVWTLYREYNMLSQTKQYDLGGPFVLSMLGDCV